MSGAHGPRARGAGDAHAPVGWTMAAVALIAACGGHRASSEGSGGVPIEPVAECREYEDALKTCFQRDTGFASQPDLLPKTDADRVRLGALCAENLQRLKRACR